MFCSSKWLFKIRKSILQSYDHSRIYVGLRLGPWLALHLGEQTIKFHGHDPDALPMYTVEVWVLNKLLIFFKFNKKSVEKFMKEITYDDLENIQEVSMIARDSFLLVRFLRLFN